MGSLSQTNINTLQPVLQKEVFHSGG